LGIDEKVHPNIADELYKTALEFDEYKLKTFYVNGIAHYSAASTITFEEVLKYVKDGYNRNTTDYVIQYSINLGDKLVNSTLIDKTDLLDGMKFKVYGFYYRPEQ
jgi:hypothetical protein